MRFTAVVLLLALALVAVAWAMGVPSSPVAAAGSGWHVHTPVRASATVAFAAAVLGSVELLAGPLPAAVRLRALAAAERLLILWRTLPLLAIAAGAAILGGLHLREAARIALRFSSPTWNYVGKRLSALAVVALVTLPVLPQPPPAWLCYLSAALAAFGVFLYVGNLPAKL